VSGDDDRLALMFRWFADGEFRSSPVYAALSVRLASLPGLAAPLLAAPPRQQRALLYFAAVQYLLRSSAPAHPLAGYLPVLGGARPLDDGLWAAFTDFVAARRPALTELCATRTTQTNEVRRAAVLRPAFGLVSGAFGPDRPVTLVELGTSAGLLLLPDRYAYRYVADGRSAGFGPAGGPVLECPVRSGWPVPVGPLPAIADRVGIDLHPVDATDAGAVAWLRSCVWPEHVDRLAQLDTALALAASVRPRFVRGDLVAALPAVMSTVDSSTVPVVFASNASTYLSDEAQGSLVAELARVGASRDLVVVVNEGAAAGVGLFTSGRYPAEPHVSMLAMVVWRGGRPSVRVLGQAAGHGTWLEWAPQWRAYDPPER
jgi:hypothetical protein